MQPTLSRPPKTMLAYAILDESEELALMTIEALIQLAAGNAGVNVANVGIAISSFCYIDGSSVPHRQFAMGRKLYSLFSQRYTAKRPVLASTQLQDKGLRIPNNM